jgi:hypothetical protein
MINETIDRLQRASVGTHHLGSRYALLLTRLWRKGDPSDLNSRSPTPGGHNHNHNNSLNAILAQNDHSANQHMQGYPDAQVMMPPPLAPSAQAPMACDFNWLDLDAVGQFAAMDDNVFAMDAMQDVEAMWYGFGIESPDFGFTEETDALDATGGHLFF